MHAFAVFTGFALAVLPTSALAEVEKARTIDPRVEELLGATKACLENISTPENTPSALRSLGFTENLDRYSNSRVILLLKPDAAKKLTYLRKDTTAVAVGVYSGTVRAIGGNFNYVRVSGLSTCISEGALKSVQNFQDFITRSEVYFGKKWKAELPRMVIKKSKISAILNFNAGDYLTRVIISKQ